jgi:formate C-acetyltransferase
MLTGEELGPRTGRLSDYAAFADFEAAFERQMGHFIGVMIRACDAVERTHAEILPSPFLSSVIDDCLERGVDVTAGGARYNLSGVQGIQIANVADSMAAVKAAVYDEGWVSADELVEALRSDFEGREALRLRLLNRVPKYGNDVERVDSMGAKWARVFAEKLGAFRNARGGPYGAGFYTVSAHVPMGKNVAATPDGRRAERPLADGGLSPVYGRDARGPTAVLRSVSRIDSRRGMNGTLLNMKFLPDIFRRPSGVAAFAALLRALVRLRIHHAQFNVVSPEDLRQAKEDPESWRHLTVRVAGYTAYFTELAGDLQDEIIARTSFGD